MMLIADQKARTGHDAASMRARAFAPALLETGIRTEDLFRKAGVSPSRPSAGLPAFVTISEDAKAIKAVKEFAKSGDMVKSGIFNNAAQGITDDRLRTMVRNGEIPTLPLLTDDQRKHLTREENAVYAVVSGLQGLYDAQPKSLEEALDWHVNNVIGMHPSMIAQEKADIASGKLPNTKDWQDLIARQEEQLAAARQGRMKIQAVNDPRLVRGVETYTVSRDHEGWVGSGQKTESDPEALSVSLKTDRFLPGSGPYTSPYVITW